jgi:hypothetical protein
MRRQRTAKPASGRPAKGRQPWLLLLGLLVLPAAALAWREYPALARYIKIERM